MRHRRRAMPAAFGRCCAALLMLASAAACDRPLTHVPAPEPLVSSAGVGPAVLDSLHAISLLLAEAWTRGEIQLPASDRHPAGAAAASAALLETLSPRFTASLERSAQPQLEASIARLREIAARREAEIRKETAPGPRMTPGPND